MARTSFREETCLECLCRFSTGNFNVEDPHSAGREKGFESTELETFRIGELCQSQIKLEQLLGVIEQDFSKHLKAINTTQKLGN